MHICGSRPQLSCELTQTLLCALPVIRSMYLYAGLILGYGYRDSNHPLAISILFNTRKDTCHLPLACVDKSNRWEVQLAQLHQIFEEVEDVYQHTPVQSNNPQSTANNVKKGFELKRPFNSVLNTTMLKIFRDICWQLLVDSKW